MGASHSHPEVRKGGSLKGQGTYFLFVFTLCTGTDKGIFCSHWPGQGCVPLFPIPGF
jgi:hypothetical protein